MIQNISSKRKATHFIVDNIVLQTILKYDIHNDTSKTGHNLCQGGMCCQLHVYTVASSLYMC